MSTSDSTSIPLNGSSNGASRASTKRLRPWGGIIFFQVEETIFEAPPCRLAEESEVFERMFHLATNDETADGRDEEHPIVLEGCHAADFRALMMVLCPTIDDVISGTFGLGKNEWIGVLDLSTKWDMKKFRNFAINELSKASLSPVEKVTLGRAHKVAKWFQDGLTELISGDPIQPLCELKSQLGAEMACTILWIQNQTLRRPYKQGLVLSGLTLSMLACWYCKEAILRSSRDCISCSQVIALDDRHALCLARGSTTMWVDPYIPVSGPAQASFCVNLDGVLCRKCSQIALFKGEYVCPSCSKGNSHRELALLPGKSVIEGDSVTQKILEEFGDEIARYGS